MIPLYLEIMGNLFSEFEIVLDRQTLQNTRSVWYEASLRSTAVARGGFHNMVTKVSEAILLLSNATRGLFQGHEPFLV
jgi:hypothetical protein